MQIWTVTDVFIGLGLALILLFGVLGPLRDRTWKERAQRAADASWRDGLYREIHFTLWSLAGACIIAWALSGRSLPALGLTWPQGWPGLGAWSVTALMGGYLVVVTLMTAGSEKTRAQVRRQLDNGELDLVKPETPVQHRAFYGVSVTAGVTEEVIYRGFLIGALAIVMPIYVAATLALALFVAGHAYQGWRGMAKVAPMGLVLTGLFVGTGSLLPGIVLHVIVDATGGAMMYLAQREAPDGSRVRVR